MAYGGYYAGYPYTAIPGGSGGVYAQPGGNYQPQANQPQNGLIWVQGETAAKSYPVAPNQTIQLWDSEAQVIYLKSADASGMPSMKILDYTIRDMTQGTVGKNLQNVDLSEYVTRQEMEKRLSEALKAAQEGNK